MNDGLYRVISNNFLTAGFIVKGGKVIECIPILRKLLYKKWIKKAIRIGD